MFDVRCLWVGRVIHCAPWFIALLIGAHGVIRPTDAFAASNAPMNYDTLSHAVKKPPTIVNGVDYDFTGLNIIGLGGGGGGTVTSITATAPIIVTPSPITDTGVISTADTAVTPGSYTNTSLTVDQKGRITAASSGSSGAQSHAVTLVVDGAGSVLSAGTKNPIKIPYGGTLVGWLLIGKPSGSITVDIFRAANGAGLPVTSIVGAGTKPALSTAVENSSTTFTSWTSIALTAKDNLAIDLSGITTTTYCALTLYFQ